MSGSFDLASLIGPVAKAVLGEPNKDLSSNKELCFGSNGSLKVKLTGERRGTWYDHEQEVGGGVFDLLREKKGIQKDEAFDWMRHNKIIEPNRKIRVVATYPYHSAAGELLYEAVRLLPKTFRLRRPNGAGGSTWNLRGVNRVPYRLPELLLSPLATPVFIVEGEKDVDNLRAMGLTATCNPEGAGKWRADFAQHFRHRCEVVILPDNDKAGEAHAADVAAKLLRAVKSVRIVRLPDLPDKGDVSDWLAAGGTTKELLRLAATAPIMEAPDAAASDGGLPPDETPPYESDEEAPRPLQVIHFSNVEAAIDVNDFVEDLLVAEGMSVVIGAPNCGKTFLVLDLALHVAQGKPWFGRDVEKGGVLYVGLEGGIGIRNRVAAYRQANGLDNAGMQFALITQPINLIDPQGVRALIHATNGLRFESKLRLIVIDTASRALAGGDENSSVDMGRLIANADIIRAATGAHILFVHHFGKDVTRGARGWSGLLGAIDTEIEVTEDGGVRTVKVRKQRDLDRAPAFSFTLEPIELGTNRRGKPVHSCVVRQRDAPKAAPSDPAPNLYGHNRRAYAVLRSLINEEGVSGLIGVPTALLSVAEQSWREAFYMGAMPGDDQGAKQKAFKRVSKDLMDRHLVTINAGRVWITSRDQPEDAKIGRVKNGEA